MRENLLKAALESKKTTSRRAKNRDPLLDVSKGSSRASSRANSRANSPAVSPSESPSGSRAPSRAGSRYGSGDSDDESSEVDPWDLGAVEEFPELDFHSFGDGWVSQLEDQIEKLTDRKRSRLAQREESLKVYNYILKMRSAQDEIYPKLSELIPTFLKSVRSEDSEKEASLALDALALTMVSGPDDAIYEQCADQVKRTISDSGSLVLKQVAIHTLSILTFYGGVSVEETQDVMDFFLEIVESDGNSIDAVDDSDVVTAALEAWGFLAAQMEDLEDASEPAMEAFIEQVQSSAPDVRIAAGNNIALLYEKSWTPLEEDETAPSEDEDFEDERIPGSTKYVKRYTVYRREDQLKHVLEEVSKVSTKKLSKKARKDLHASFADILNTVEHPTRGPNYSTAINQETGKRYGSRLVIRGPGGMVMVVDKWWKNLIMEALKRTLEGGFMYHLENNQVVADTLDD